MRSAAYDILPLKITKSLKKLGSDIVTARKKRKLTVEMMAERIGVSKGTYQRIERGQANVGIGIYAMTFLVLGFGDILGDLLDPRNDDHGLLLDEQRLPQRIRAKKQPTGL